MSAADGFANTAQAEFWNDVAASWTDARPHSERISERFGRRGIDALRLRVGEHVLDIGCGTGETTRILADAVHPGGDAVGVDLSSAMIDVARREVFHGGASFEVADIQTQRPSGAPFDAAFSRFGVMFFADPAAAFANIRSLLHPGGRLAFCCWGRLVDNEWMMVPGAAVVQVTGAPPSMPGPTEAGPFSLADPERITELLAGAGFSSTNVETVVDPFEAPEAAIEDMVELAKSIGPVREALRGADDDFATELLAAVRSQLAARVVDAEPEPDNGLPRHPDAPPPPPPARLLRLSATAHIVSARA